MITTPPPQAPIPPATARQLEELVRGHLRNGDLAAGLRAAVERVRTVRMGDEPLVAVPGNPPVPGIEGHLTDASRRLPDGDRKSIDDQLSALQSDAQVDMAMFILSRPVESLVDMGKSCFRTWSIGKSWSSGGVLLIVSHDLKDCAVVMTDKEFPLPGMSSKELEEMVRERLRKGELAGGLGAAIGRVRNLLLSGKSQLVAKGNPPVPGIESHLTDAGKRLAEKDRLSIDELLGSIQADAKVDAVVFILATPVKTLAEMGRACFDTWNVGKSWEGGGVLLIVSKDLKDCALVMSGKDSPLKAEAARQLEVNVRERLAQGKPASAIRFAVERMRRQLSLRRRPTVHPRFRPNEEGARRYALGSLLILLLALGSNAVRRWKKWV